MGLVQAGMLSALAALAIPIIIHLMFGQRARRIDLGTLRFLKIVLVHDSRRKRLKRWMLLVLRMACVALLVFLFARPYFLVTQTGSEDSLVILLLDRSASMELKQGGRRLFDAAVQQAQEIEARCGEATRIEAAWFDHAVHPLSMDGTPTSSWAWGQHGHEDAAMPPGSSASMTEQVEAAGSARDFYGATDYGAAMAWAGDIATQSKHRSKDLYLFTDLQRSGLERTAASPLPDDLVVHLVDLGRAYPENVAVTAAVLSKVVVRPGEMVSVKVTVRNTGPFARESVPVTLRLQSDGAQRDFHSGARLDAGGTANVRFDLPVLPEGLWQGYAAVKVEDELAFDNRRYVALLVAAPIKVLVVDGSPGTLPVTAESYFLETAIRLAQSNESYSGSPFMATVVPNGPGASLPDLGDARLVVLANVGDLSVADARRLADAVRHGGGLLVFPGNNASAESCRTLADAGLCPGAVGPAVPADSLPWRLESWDQQHPVFRPFADPQYGDLRRLAFRAYTPIAPDADAAVLARFRGGDPAVLEKRLGPGKVVWWTTSCGLEGGDWPRSRLYVPMVHQLLGYLAGLTEGGPVREEEIGDWGPGTTVWGLGTSVQGSGLRVQGTFLSPPHPPTPSSLTPGVFAREGFTEVLNTDPRESETDRCTPEQFAAWFHFRLPSEEDAASAQSAARATLGDHLRPNEVWHWVILGLLGCLFLEVFLANRTAA